MARDRQRFTFDHQPGQKPCETIQFGGVELLELDEESADDLLFSLTKSNLVGQSANILGDYSQPEGISGRGNETGDNRDRGPFAVDNVKKEEMAAKVILRLVRPRVATIRQ